MMYVPNLSLCLLLVIACGHVQSVKVLLVSMDGFRWDYIKQTDTPNFDNLAKSGTRAEYINNPYIGYTLPNHYSIDTGLYEESHGIVANTIYDPEFNATMTQGNQETRWWDGGEPLWVTVQKNNMKSGVYFWPVSDAEIQGRRPNLWKSYDGSVPFYSRVDDVIQWLVKDDIDVAMLYFIEPDQEGHKYGPNSPQVLKKVREMDDLVGYIVKEFKDNGLWDTVNLIITSDHGMEETDYVNKMIDLSKYIDISKVYQCPQQGPSLNMLPYEGYEDEIYNAIKNIPHMTVYKKQDIPERLHYKNNRRILPILAVAEKGWQIALNASAYPDKRKGQHGYDNTLMSMKPIFYARGPNFKANFKATPFQSVDIYPMICNIFGINPAPNNGSLAATRDFVVISGSETKSTNLNLLLASLLTMLACRFGM